MVGREPLTPPGVTVNALSPIAATRMVRETVLAAGTGPKGLDLSAMPQAVDMAPAAALLASEASGWCRGHVLFSAGSELSLIAPPRLVEAVGTAGQADFGTALSTLVPVVFGPAEAQQRTNGGSNPRFGPIGAAPAQQPPALSRNCLVVSDDLEIVTAVREALARWGYAVLESGTASGGFTAATQAVRKAGRIDVVVVALRETPTGGDADWRQVLASHSGTARRVLDHAAWLHAAVEYANSQRQPIRAVHVVPADSPGGRSAAQAVTQMARSAQDTPSDLDNHVFAVTVEGQPGDWKPLAALVARLVGAEDTRRLAGAELVARGDWVGLRSHPSPVATVAFGGPTIPAWVPDALREAIH